VAWPWLLSLVLAALPPGEAARAASRHAAAPIPEKPPQSAQKQKSSKERGVNPCNTKDPGFGAYGPWERGIGRGQMIVPRRFRGGAFDVVVHFHGHEAARKEFVQVMNGPILVGIDLGLGSGPYETAFRPHGTLRALLESVERALEARHGKPTRVRHVALSAWSAGYGAVQNILRDPWAMEHVDSVVLLDGLHAGYSGRSLNEAQLEPFIEFSARAARGRRLMVVTHSSIIPPGYASTTETANFLVLKLGARPRKAKPRASDPMGLELISRFSRGGFHVRGFAGNDTLDHCAHLGLYRDVLSMHLAPRWKVARVSRH